MCKRPECLVVGGRLGVFLLVAIFWVFLSENFSCPMPPPVYPLKVSSNKRYLVDQHNTPFLVQGDAPWSLISGLTQAEADSYLENRRLKGFNTLMVNLIEHKFHGPVNREGEGPFATPGDFSTPNEKYFAHADWVIRKAAEKGSNSYWPPAIWATRVRMRGGMKRF